MLFTLLIFAFGVTHAPAFYALLRGRSLEKRDFLVNFSKIYFKSHTTVLKTVFVTVCPRILLLLMFFVKCGPITESISVVDIT